MEGCLWLYSAHIFFLFLQTCGCKQGMKEQNSRKMSALVNGCKHLQVQEGKSLMGPIHNWH